MTLSMSQVKDTPSNVVLILNCCIGWFAVLNELDGRKAIKHVFVGYVVRPSNSFTKPQGYTKPTTASTTARTPALASTRARPKRAPVFWQERTIETTSRSLSTASPTASKQQLGQQGEPPPPQLQLVKNTRFYFYPYSTTTGATAAAEATSRTNTKRISNQ